MFHIAINNTEGKILENLNLDQLSVISNLCSFEVEASEYKANAIRNRTRGKAEWDGYRRLFNASTQKFPVGLLDRITKLFNTVGIPYELVDYRTHTDKVLDIIPSEREYRQYQHDCVLQSILHGNGIVKVATGGGKTTIAGLTIAALGKRTVFIVHTKDLLYQAKDALSSMLHHKVGQIGDGVFDPMDVTIATVQTLCKFANNDDYEDYKYDEDYTNDERDIDINMTAACRKWMTTVGSVQFDEVQRVGSRTAFATRFMFHNADHAYGYSASPWRDDGADLMIEAAFGPMISNVTASELIRHNPPYLVQPTIIIKRTQGNVWSGKDYTQIYKTAVVENMFRNMQVVEDAIHHYDAGRCTLVLVTQIKHGNIIEGMLRSVGKPAQFISGKSNARYRKQVIEDMRNGKAPLIIASTIADVGLDVPRISAMVEAGAGKSSVTALQRVGREMRLFPGKTECYFNTYRDTAPFLCNQIDRKIQIWKTEPEFKIVEV